MIFVYSKNNCPACVKLKAELDAKGTVYQEVNIDKDPRAKEWLINNGYRSVPQMFESAQHLN
jgi:glutaredoxin